MRTEMSKVASKSPDISPNGLRERREAAGLSLDEVAAETSATGVSNPSLSKYERALHVLSDDQLQQVSDAITRLIQRKFESLRGQLG